MTFKTTTLFAGNGNETTDLQDAFAGPFKARERPDATWGPKRDDHSHFECADPAAGEHLTVNSRQYQMVDGAVRQAGGALSPIYTVRLISRRRKMTQLPI